MTQRFDQRHRIALGLGGNRGAVSQAMNEALQLLEQSGSVSVISRSSLYQTAPIGRATSPFLNSAALIETDRSLEEVLSLCQDAERKAGREATARWDDRPLDVDLLLSDQETASNSRLSVPHQWLHIRRFALDPLCEICGGWVHPGFGRSIDSMGRHWRRERLRVSFGKNLSMPTGRENRWGDRVEVVDSAADLQLSCETPEPACWPPVVDVRQFPLELDAAIVAALDGIVDEPRRLTDGLWSNE